MRSAAIAALLLAAVVVPAPASSQVQPTVRMSATPSAVPVSGTVRVEVRAEIPSRSRYELSPPDFRGFEQVGRSVSRPISVSLGFGQPNQTIRRTEVHVYHLRALQEGTFQFPPAVLRVNGQSFESTPITITVGAGGRSNAPPADTPPTDLSGAQVDPTAFLRTVAEPEAPYVGQQVTVTLYLYSQERIDSARILTDLATDGFWVQDLASLGTSPGGEESAVIDGKRYRVRRVRRLAVFPLEAGRKTFGRPALELTLGGSPFGAIFGGPGPQSITREGEEVTVDVRPLPEDGQPPGPVHVGSLRLEASLDRSQVATRDAVTLTVTARGRGRIGDLELTLPEQPGLRVLQPEVEDELDATQDVLGGRRTVRWLIVPEEPGTYALPPFEVAVFDPEIEAWAPVRTPALSLLAAGNPSRTAAPAPTGVEDEPSPATGAEAARFGPVRTESALARSHVRLTEQPWFRWSFLLGPLLIGGALAFAGLRRRARRATEVTPKTVVRAARKRLAQAEQSAAAGDASGFYAEIATALKEVLASKMGHPVGSLTHAELERALTARGLDAALARQVVDELEGSDFARFSAVGVSEAEMSECVGRTRHMLAALDRFRPAPLEDDA